MTAKTLAVANQKGGVGKTSTAVNVAYTAASAEWNVLLVDLDPQGNIGVDLGYAWTDKDDKGQNLFDALVSARTLTPLKDVRPNLDVVPAGEYLKDVEDVLAGRSRRGSDTRGALRDALDAHLDDYDLIVVDTPPTNPSLLQLALVACENVLIPTKSDRASISGLAGLGQEMTRARELNPNLEPVGAVLFDISTNATVVRRNAIEDIHSALQGAAPVFNAAIRHVEATAAQSRESGLLPVELAQKSASAEPFWKALREGRSPERTSTTASSLAEDYIQLTNEVLTRLTELGVTSHE